ncbi:MAG: aldo/keto reductase, partial [Sutterella wadsworthensis]
MTQAPLMDRIHITEDYDVPRVINGGWQLSAGHALERPLDLADASRAFNRLIDMGFDTFDCADIYTGVEDFFGGIIRERRKAGLRLPQIHTKFVPDLNDLANVTPAYIENIITRSLRRLGVERLDAVQFHWWDYSVPGMV